MITALGLAVVGLLWWSQNHSVTGNDCVLEAIQRMEVASRGRPVPSVATALTTDATASLDADQRAAIKAFQRCGLASVAALRRQLQIGTRRRRWAQQTLLLGAGRDPRWREAIAKAMWKALSHKGWRVREAAFVVLWRLETQVDARRKLWSQAATDVHHFLRYAAAAASRRTTPQEQPLEQLVSLLQQGAAEGGHSAHDGHHHGKKKATKEVSGGGKHWGVGSVEQWLRQRNSCRVDVDYDWPARRQIVVALRQWKLPTYRKVHLWLDAMSDRHKAVQAAAKDAILAQGAKAIPALEAVFLKAPTSRKHRVAALLGAMPERSADVLLKLLEHRDPGVWHAAAKGLLQAANAAASTTEGRRARRGIVDVLCRRFGTDGKRRRAIAPILALGGPPGTRCLLGFLQLGTVTQQIDAARGLGQQAQTLCQNPTSPSCRALVVAALSPLLSRREAVSPRLQAEALWAVSRMGPAAYKALVPLLSGLPQLHLRPLQVRQAWLRGLVWCGCGAPEVMSRLVAWQQTPSSTKDIASQVSLLRALIGSAKRCPLASSALALWLDGLSSKQPAVRAATRALLASYSQHHEALFSKLLPGLKAKSHDTRASTALALSRWSRWPAPARARAVKRLASLCLQDSHRQAQEAAALALRHLARLTKGNAPKGPWLKMLAHRRWPIRVNAAEALAAMGPSAAFAINGLIAALRDRKRQVRRAAAVALGRIGKAAAPAQNALKRAMGDHAIDVQHAAKRALADVRTAMKR